MAEVLNENEQENEDGLQENEGQETQEVEPLIGIDEEEAEEEIEEEGEPEEGEPVKKNPVREQRIALKEKNKELRAKEREIQELRKKLEGDKKVEEADELPPKPILKDFEWVEEDHQKALDVWVEKKIAFEKKQEKKKQQEENEKAEVGKIVENYKNSIKALNLPDYEQYEIEVSDVLSKKQQDAILGGCNNPALIVATLAKNPKRLEALKNLGDTTKFAIALGHLEKEIGMMKRTTTKAPPEKPLGGGGGSGGGGSGLKAKLAQLRDNADKTGKRDEVIRFLKQHPELR